jgi:hypothetical protein
MPWTIVRIEQVAPDIKDLTTNGLFSVGDIKNDEWFQNRAFSSSNGLRSIIYMSQSSNGSKTYRYNIYFREQSGGTKKPTKKRVKVNGKNHIVYEGQRGGQYIKQNGGFVNIKSIKS